MIYFKIEIQGEPDTSPSTQTFTFKKKSDEEIFFNTVGVIKKRLGQNLKINLYETISILASFIISQLRENKKIKEIQENASNLLVPDQVMFGVPESLQKISFEINLDDNPSQEITLITPIPVRQYLLKGT